jgi:predicted AAA+ superfamily ATPase
MVKRRFWLNLIEQASREKPVVWLAGVRRVGKTCLCQSLPDVEYFDCELPRVRRMMEDPQGFLDGLRGRRVVLDEVHRLGNPSELLKIAADHYADIRVLATGSSTLGASSKFRDTLAGRKRDLWLTPMCLEDLRDFRRTDLRHRFLHGGLPPFFLAGKLPERDFQEWLDAYWAKDIQELFRLERRHSFLRFAELLWTQSGGIFEASSFAGPCEISRGSVTNYQGVLEATAAVHVIRPFHSHTASEIVAAPKVYGFDTGFVCYYRGWDRLREDDLGPLWEHYVLNEFQSRLPDRQVRYWRDKQRHEIDFVLSGRGDSSPRAVECKWSADEFEPAALLAFRRRYPHGENLVVAQDVDRSFSRDYRGVEVRFVSLEGLIEALTSSGER